MEEHKAKERQGRRIEIGAVVSNGAVEDGSYTESACQAEEGIDTVPAEFGIKMRADKEQHTGDIRQGRIDNGRRQKRLD
jgi:hypothetical protein